MKRALSLAASSATGSAHNYFSQNKWGDARHYHLAISSVYGVDFAVEVLKHAALSFPEGVGE